MTLIELARKHRRTFGGITPAIWVISDLSETEFEKLLISDSEASQELIDAVGLIAKRYRKGEPLQYLLGHWNFRKLDLLCDERALIPRPETEHLVDLVFARLKGKKRLLGADLGTGSGAIGLSLATSNTFDLVYMTDLSSPALNLASENLERNRRLFNSKIFMSHGSWFAGLPASCVGSLDLVISNPPYIPTSAIASLDGRVLAEPIMALDGGPAGMSSLLEIVAGATKYLSPDGLLALEIGEDHGETLAGVANSFGYLNIEVVKDQTDRVRYFFARKPNIA